MEIGLHLSELMPSVHGEHTRICSVVLLDVILMKYTDWESPIGSLLLAGDGETLNYLSFPLGEGQNRPR